MILFTQRLPFKSLDCVSGYLLVQSLVKKEQISFCELFVEKFAQKPKLAMKRSLMLNKHWMKE